MKTRIIFMVLLFSSLTTSAVWAQDDEWRVDLDTWIWAMGIEGDIGARGLTSSVDATFFDVLDASDSLIGLAGRLEIGKGKWAGFVDGAYNKIGVDNATGSLGIAKVDVTIEQAVVDFGLMYRLMDKPSDQGSRRNNTLDVYAGARYQSLDIELDPATLPTRDHSQNWIDPIIGLKTTIPLSERFYLLAWGDIGGFGVASDFTWATTAILGYDFTLFSRSATVFGGYRAIGTDYTDGSGANKFTWDATLHGPILGLTIKF
ncbi:MAG: hypothetical protein IT445_18335 [Phycisphaeraceae bacterium]|nr:hypothetical protein [Phycisphaeraceae bacterium]